MNPALPKINTFRRGVFAKRLSFRQPTLWGSNVSMWVTSICIVWLNRGRIAMTPLPDIALLNKQ